MLTVKIIDERHSELLVAADSVALIRDYDAGDFPDRLEILDAEGFPLRFVNGKAHFGCDRAISPRCQVFVMNAGGATVADYVFSRDPEAL